MKKLKLISMILAVIMVVSMLPLGMVSAFAAGPGDEENPTIGTAAEFVEFMNNWIGTAGYYDGKTVKLTADIDLTGVELPKLYKESATAGTYEKIENTFTGTFDGQNHTISGYAIVESRSDGISNPELINDVYGLFGRTLAGTATIQNLTLNGVLGKDYVGQPKSGAVVNAADVGALYGWIDGTLTVENVTVNGITSGSRSAGFVYGVSGEGTATFTNCEMGGKVLNHWVQKTYDGVGGFVGRNDGEVEITNCLMSGYVAEMRLNTTTGGDNGMIHMGGLVGYNSGSLEISGSIVSGTVVSHSTEVKTATANVGLGGFVGYSKGTCTITGSMVHQFAKLEAKLPASATTTSGYNVGGFVGRSENSTGALTVVNCAMYGTVTSNSARSGLYFGHSGAADFTLKGCISGGSGTMNTRSNQLGYGGTITNNNANYNIQTSNSNQGMASTYAKNSICDRPYYVTAANLYTLDKLTTAVKALIDAADSTDPNGEVAGVTTQFGPANWTFSGSALPVPVGCESLYNSMMANVTIDSYGDLMTFAAQLNASNTFEGKTVKMTADVVVNDGWNAFTKTNDTLTGDDTTTEKAITAAAILWPVGGGKSFAGTFDGQGHTISGIYQVVVAQNVGIFGIVAENKTATIKNVKIVNSYVRGAQGTGGLFGIAQATVNIDNVYANINVDSGYVNTTLGTSNYSGSSNRSNGTAGLIGGCNGKAVSYTITNTVFDGEVYGGHLRGVSAFCGNATTAGTITINNCYAKATLTSDAAKASSGKQAGAGAFVGYAGNNAAEINISNAIADCKYTGTTSVVGCLVGGAHTAATYTFANVTYVDYADDNASLVIASNAVAKDKEGVVIATLSINGKTFDESKLAADFTEEEWKTYGVKKVASAAKLPPVLFALNVSDMSVTLTDDLAINLYADYAIANKDYEGDDIVVTKVGDEYRISYVNILPQQIGDDVVFDLGTAGKKTENIQSYLTWLLDDEKAKHVAADLLRYGAAAQIKADYKTDALVTAGLEPTLEGLGTDFEVDEIQASAPNVANKGIIEGMALRLENSLAMIAGDENQTVIATTPVMASQMDETLKLDAGNGSYVECSVAWYVKAALNGGVTDEADLDLIKAIYAYGLSAKAYANA